jgi:hypothetical protein
MVVEGEKVGTSFTLTRDGTEWTGTLYYFVQEVTEASWTAVRAEIKAWLQGKAASTEWGQPEFMDPRTSEEPNVSWISAHIER